MMVRFKGQNEANFATLVVSVEDINDNPPQFLQVSRIFFLIYSSKARSPALS